MSSRWVSKPPVGSQISWGHPLSKGLVGCWLMNEVGGKTALNLADNKLALPIGSPSFRPTSKGSSLYTTGATDVLVENPSFILPANSRVSVVALVRPNAQNITRKRVVRCSNPTNGSTWTIDFGNAVTDHIYFGTQISAGSFSSSAAYSAPANTWVHVAGVWCLDNYIRIYVDTTERTYYSQVNPSTSLISSQCYLGNSSANFPFGGDINYIYIYNRSISPSEIQSLYESPYQFIKGPSTITYFTAPAGGWVWGGEVKNVMVA